MQIASVDTAALDAIFAPFDRTDAPGFAVGVALGGTPAYRRGFGMASIELPVPLSPTIRMRIGSITKHFTVLLLMLLAEEGRMSLDDSPRILLPELPVWAETMTVRQLMSHTSGMRDSLDLVLHGSGAGRTASTEFQLRYLASLDDVNFAAGTSWCYNNGGYLLLAEIATRISGLPFAKLLRHRLFEPVGMYDTMLRPLDTDLVPNSASLHVPVPGGGYERGVFGTAIGGEGGIVSTVDDMLRWLRHMGRPIVGSSATWREMRTPHVTNGYGLGLIARRHRGVDTIGHAGAVVGGSSQMVKVLNHDLDIVLMSNGISSVEGYRLVDAIIDRCIPGLPGEATGMAGEPVVGTFHSRQTGRVMTLDSPGGQQRISLHGLTLPAVHGEDGRMRLPILPTDLSLAAEAGGAALAIHEFGADDRLERQTAPVHPPVPLGRYHNGGAQLQAAISCNGDVVELTMTGPLGALAYRLTAIGPGLWEGRALGALPLLVTLEFDGGGFLLTSGRTIRLPFRSVG